MNLRDRSKGLPVSLRESDAAEETARTRGGQKCSVIKHPLTESPAWAHRERTDSHNAPRRSASPRGSSRTAQEFRFGVRRGLQLGGEFLPSSFSPSYCLAVASQCSLSGSVVLTARCFDISFAQGQGSARL